MFKWLLPILLVLLYTTIYAQDKTIEIKGRLIDTLNQKAINSHSFFISTDSTKIFCQTSSDGTFSLRIPKSNSKYVFITVNGYSIKTLSYRNPIRSDLSLGTIYLTIKLRELDEVKIKGSKKPKDTLEFVMRDSVFKNYNMTEYALKKIPGITIINNEVYYNGNKVNSLNINGKNFLFNDDGFLLSNLPAFTIDKVQLINKNVNNSNKFDPEINIVLKPNSSTGYINNILLAYGTNKRENTNVIFSRIDPNNEIGINVESNNINNENIYKEQPQPLTLPGLTNNLKLRGVYRKSINKLNFDILFTYDSKDSYNQQNTQRTDLTQDTIISNNFNNISEDNHKTYQLSDGLEYKINKNNVLYFKQNIASENDYSLSSTLYNNFVDSNKNNISNYQINNRYNIFKISNKLLYTYRGSHSRFSNNYLNISLEHKYFNELQNDNYLINGIDEPNRNNLSGNSYNFNASYINNFADSYSLNIGMDNKLNFLNNDFDTDTLTSVQKQVYEQNIDETTVTISRYKKHNDIQIGIDLYNYLILQKDAILKMHVTQLLPLITYTYKLNDNNKITLDYSKKANSYTLEQLTQLTNSNNNIFASSENYAIKPELIDDYTLTYISSFGKFGIYINAGYQQKTNAVSNQITDPNDPIFIVQNIGTTKVNLINSRFEYKITDNLKAILNANYNSSTFASAVNSRLISRQTNNTITAVYTIAGFETSLSGELNLNKSEFISTDNNKYNFLTTTINYNLRGDIFKRYHLLLLNSLLINKVSDQQSQTVVLITPQISGTFLPNKNLDIFLVCKNLLSNNENKQYDIQPSYIQYSNVLIQGRYLMFGIKFKFNTLKR